MTQEEIIEKEAEKFCRSIIYNSSAFTVKEIKKQSFKAGITEAISNPGKYGLQPLTDSKELDNQMISKEDYSRICREGLSVSLELNTDSDSYKKGFHVGYITGATNNQESKIKSIKFAEWIYNEGWRNYDSNETWINGIEVLNTTQLYDRFLKLRNLG